MLELFTVLAAVAIVAFLIFRYRSRKVIDSRPLDARPLLPSTPTENERNYLDVLRRELANMMLRKDAEEFANTFWKMWSYEQEMKEASLSGAQDTRRAIDIPGM